MPLLIKIEIHNEGGILGIGTSDGKHFGEYAISGESIAFLVEMVGNVINHTDPYRGTKFMLPWTEQK